MSLFVCSLPCFPAPPPSLPINLHTCFPCTHHKIICLLAYNNNLLSFCLIFESLCILSVRLTPDTLFKGLPVCLALLYSNLLLQLFRSATTHPACHVHFLSCSTPPPACLPLNQKPLSLSSLPLLTFFHP